MVDNRQTLQKLRREQASLLAEIDKLVAAWRNSLSKEIKAARAKAKAAGKEPAKKK